MGDARSGHHASASTRRGCPCRPRMASWRWTGRPGVVLERIEGPSMWSRMKAAPSELPAPRRPSSSDLQVTLQAAGPIARPAGPRQPAAQQDRRGRRRSPARSGTEAHALLARMPAGTALCHGDMHPANILMAARGWVIVDWFDAADRLRRGRPGAQLAAHAAARPRPSPPTVTLTARRSRSWTTSIQRLSGLASGSAT